MKVLSIMKTFYSIHVGHDAIAGNTTLTLHYNVNIMNILVENETLFYTLYFIIFS